MPLPLVAERTNSISATKQEAQDNGCLQSLTAMLSNSEALNFLYKYLREREFSDENLSFYQEVDKFKSTKEPQTVAAEMIKKYIVLGAPSQINIDEDLRKSIQQKFRDASGLAASQFPVELFDEAQYFTFRLIQDHSYPRFLQSAECQQLLKRMDAKK